jgi:transcriptional regulator with XRE-family HTH domain
MRQVRGIKQFHLVELMGVTQSAISRWERGTLPLSPDDFAAVQECLQVGPEPSLDAALKRLIESSTLRVHLVCDRTHRLLAASPSRQSEWCVNVSALKRPVAACLPVAGDPRGRGAPGRPWLVRGSDHIARRHDRIEYQRSRPHRARTPAQMSERDAAGGGDGQWRGAPVIADLS